MMKTKNLLIICVAIFIPLLIVLVFGFLLWPTLYHYEEIRLGSISTPVRINRLTGHTEKYSPMAGEWIAAKEDEEQRVIQTLPFSESVKVTGSARLSGYGSFGGSIYNGSSWTITKLRFSVTAKEEGGSVRWDRKFDKPILLSPLTSKEFHISVAGDAGVRSQAWHIDGAWGYKAESPAAAYQTEWSKKDLQMLQSVIGEVSLKQQSLIQEYRAKYYDRSALEILAEVRLSDKSNTKANFDELVDKYGAKGVLDKICE